MKNAIIFLNGDRTNISGIKQYITKDSLLIGVDGGTNHILEFGLKPHVIIGDFDSFSRPSTSLRGMKRRSNLFPSSLRKRGSRFPIKPGMTKNIEYIRYPRDKDLTDGELAIRYAIENGYKTIIVTGLLGSRIDHVLGNILLLLKKEYAGISIKIIEGNQEIYLIQKHAVIRGKKGDTISFIPIDTPVNKMKSIGLQYDLGKYKLSTQGNRGISNVMIKDIAEISIKKGVLLVIHTKTTPTQ